MRRALALGWMLAVVAWSAVARAEEAAPPPADPVAALRAALAEYDQRSEGQFFNTIPLEQAILAVATAGRHEALAEFAAHERFGALALAVGCEGAPPAAVPALLKAWEAAPAGARTESAICLASSATEPVRAALARLAADEAVVASEAMAAAVRAARLRAGDPALLGETKKALASKDPDVAAQALLLAGDARLVAFLPEFGRLAEDARRLAHPAESRWPDTKTTTTTNEAGETTTTSSRVPVAVDTVGAAAVEAANRACATTLPEMMAWWYWPEKGPRFGRAPGGAAKVKALVAQDAKAAKAKSPTGTAAVAAVLRGIAGEGQEGAEFVFVSATFDKAWTVAWTLNGTEAKAVVDAAGKVTRR